MGSDSSKEATGRSNNSATGRDADATASKAEQELLRLQATIATLERETARIQGLPDEMQRLSAKVQELESRRKSLAEGTEEGTTDFKALYLQLQAENDQLKTAAETESQASGKVLEELQNKVEHLEQVNRQLLDEKENLAVELQDKEYLESKLKESEHRASKQHRQLRKLKKTMSQTSRLPPAPSHSPPLIPVHARALTTPADDGSATGTVPSSPSKADASVQAGKHGATGDSGGDDGVLEPLPHAPQSILERQQPSASVDSLPRPSTVTDFSDDPKDPVFDRRITIDGGPGNIPITPLVSPLVLAEYEQAGSSIPPGQQDNAVGDVHARAHGRRRSRSRSRSSSSDRRRRRAEHAKQALRDDSNPVDPMDPAVALAKNRL